MVLHRVCVIVRDGRAAAHTLAQSCDWSKGTKKSTPSFFQTYKKKCPRKFRSLENSRKWKVSAKFLKILQTLEEGFRKPPPRHATIAVESACLQSLNPHPIPANRLLAKTSLGPQGTSQVPWETLRVPWADLERPGLNRSFKVRLRSRTGTLKVQNRYLEGPKQVPSRSTRGTSLDLPGTCFGPSRYLFLTFRVPFWTSGPFKVPQGLSRDLRST